jgi:hypothetical protein
VIGGQILDQYAEIKLAGREYMYLRYISGFVVPRRAPAQSLGNAGTIEGVVVDPSGASI